MRFRAWKAAACFRKNAVPVTRHPIIDSIAPLPWQASGEASGPTPRRTCIDNSAKDCFGAKELLRITTIVRVWTIVNYCRKLFTQSLREILFCRFSLDRSKFQSIRPIQLQQKAHRTAAKPTFPIVEKYPGLLFESHCRSCLRPKCQA